MTDKKRGEYLNTTRPRGWVILCAVFLMLVVFMFWSFTDSILKIQKISVVVLEDQVYGCIGLKHISKDEVQAGREVLLSREQRGEIEKVDRYLYKPMELEEKFGTAIVSQMEVPEFTIMFEIKTDAELVPGMVQPGWLILGEINPISLWFGEE